MEFFELINVRRSCRKFKENKVPLEVVEDIILDSTMAPGWKNGANTRYYLAYSDGAIKAVRDALPIFNQNNTPNGVIYIISTFINDKSGFDIKSGKQSDVLGNIWVAYDNRLHDS